MNKLKTKDLNPGNYLGMNLNIDPFNIFEVLEVGRTMAVKQSSEKLFYDIEDLEGLPLKEEGFRANNFKEVDGFFYHPEHNDYSFMQYADGVWIAYYNDCVLPGVRGFVWFHELQNFYNLLFGFDITNH